MFRLFACSAVALAIAPAANAAVLAAWDFNDQNTVVDASDPLVTVSNIDEFAGTGPTAVDVNDTQFVGDGAGGSAWRINGNLDGPNPSFDDAGEFRWSIDVPAGVFVDLDTVSWRHSAQDAGTAQLVINGVVLGNTTVPNGNSTWTTLVESESVGPLGLTGFTDTTIEFAIRFDTNGGGDTRRYGIDDLVVEGTALIPEPAFLSLVAAGSLAMLLPTRRRRA
ncbi:MAG: hypothetical protein AAF823_07880 [Planctomycetota bacterium]